MAKTIQLIQPSDDTESRWLLDMAYFKFSEFYLTDDEALAFADWLDLITGGGSDSAIEIREAVRSRDPRGRLEYLRGEIRAERINYGELAELQDLVAWIDPGDVELLEWAGVPEHNHNEENP